MRPIVPLVLATTMLAPRAVAAQGGPELIAQGVAAYRALDYVAAIALLRRGLAVEGLEAVTDTARATAFIYLGAAELLRDRSRDADAAFRQALATHPGHRPDMLIFPPNITNAFEAVRRQTAYVRVVAPDTSVRPGSTRYPMLLQASAPHEVTVAVVRDDGAMVRRVYTGPVRDTLTVSWDGLDGAGDPLVGAVAIEVASPGRNGGQRLVRLPLEVRTTEPDTLRHPARPVPGEARRARSFDWRQLGTLAGGLVAGAAVVALPSLIAHDGNSEPARYAVGIALGLGGIVGFLSQQPPSPQARPADEALAAWRAALDRVRTENLRRRRDRILLVRAGVPTVIGNDP